MANNKVDIDVVYRKVLALANKEQRGYVTPQEFNLFASQAQLEIFENYFHDLKTAQLKPTNSTDVGDEIDLLNERISIHRVIEGVNETSSAGVFTLTDNAYILTAVKLSNIEVDQVDMRTLRFMERNALTKATQDRPVYVRINANQINIYPTTITSSVQVEYIKKPDTPNWTYIVVNNKALHNPSASDKKDFDLHESEENNLVMRILELAGITLNDPALIDIALRDRNNTKAEKNN
jgi:hypothetical protein